MDVQTVERPASVQLPPTALPETLPRRESNPELEQESRILLIRHSDKRDQIMEAQQIIGEINKMLDETSNKVLEQEFQTSTIMEISEDSLVTVRKGNTNLVQANAYSKQIGKWWIWFFNVLTIVILLLDFLKS